MVLEWSIPIRVSRLDDKCKKELRAFGYDDWYVPILHRIGGTNRYLPVRRTPVVFGFSIGIGY